MSDETLGGEDQADGGRSLRGGSEFAGHRIEAELGRGGMGVVYRARHIALDAPRALKVIAPGLSADQLFRERFRRESRLAASIDHPNVITIHHAGEEGELLYISMRLVDGTDLRELVESEGVPTVRRVAGVISSVAAALDAAHDAGLVHRDVKPANVLIEPATGEGERVFLTDFGISRVSGGGSTVTGAGELLGSVDYVAPEQIEGGEVDYRADVYSLGCLAHYTLTGQAPFPVEGDLARLYAHAHSPRPRPSRLRTGLPKSIDAVIGKAMAIRPNDRYESAGDMAAALRASLRDAGAEADEMATRRIAIQPEEDGGRRFGRLAAAGIVIFVIVAALAAVLVFGEEGSDDSTVSSAGSVVASIDVKAKPAGVTVGPKRVWVAAGDSLDAINPKTNKQEANPHVPGKLVSVAIGYSSIWIVDREGGGVFRLDLDSHKPPKEFKTGANPNDVVTGYGAVWVANEGDNTVSRINAETGDTQQIRVGTTPHALAAGGNAIWVANIGDGTVTRIEKNGSIKTNPIQVGQQPNDIAFGGGYVWVCDVLEGQVRKINPNPDSNTRGEPSVVDGDPISVDPRPRGIKVGLGGVWVASAGPSTVSRIDPDTGEVNGKIDVGREPADIALGKGSVWTADSGSRTVTRIDPGG